MSLKQVDTKCCVYATEGWGRNNEKKYTIQVSCWAGWKLKCAWHGALKADNICFKVKDEHEDKHIRLLDHCNSVVCCFTDFKGANSWEAARIEDTIAVWKLTIPTKNTHTRTHGTYHLKRNIQLLIAPLKSGIESPLFSHFGFTHNWSFFWFFSDSQSIGLSSIVSSTMAKSNYHRIQKHVLNAW